MKIISKRKIISEEFFDILFSMIQGYTIAENNIFLFKGARETVAKEILIKNKTLEIARLTYKEPLSNIEVTKFFMTRFGVDNEKN